ncbi:MAG: MazG family protein [Bifidobacteriaceae bacterium]|nr:MazG family protein [Bifidobacteriaceae bacterium]
MSAQPSPSEAQSQAVADDCDPVARLVAVMDRLRAPGGCPWDAQQTHTSLVQYLLEEAYEAAEALERGDRRDMREELGDVLLQVVFHASIAAEDQQDPFDLGDVAAAVADKLIRRHPHVFAASQPAPASAEESHRRWDRIKAVEKSRTSVLDGIPLAQSPLARAQKVVGRARRAGLRSVPLEVSQGYDAARPAPVGRPDPAPHPAAAARSAAPTASAALNGVPDLGERLLALVVEADSAGLDAEQELRAATRRLVARIEECEALERSLEGGV